MVVVLWREYSDRDHFAGVFYANRLLDGDHADKDEAAGAALRAKWLPKIYGTLACCLLCCAP